MELTFLRVKFAKRALSVQSLGGQIQHSRWAVSGQNTTPIESPCQYECRTMLVSDHAYEVVCIGRCWGVTAYCTYDVNTIWQLRTLSVSSSSLFARWWQTMSFCSSSRYGGIDHPECRARNCYLGY